MSIVHEQVYTIAVEQVDGMVFLWTMPNGVSYGSPETVMKEWFMPYLAELYQKMLDGGEYVLFKMIKTLMAELDKITVELME